MSTTGTIVLPERPENVPESAQWLGGQGIGGWFYLEASELEKQYRIIRYSPEGICECNRIFTLVTSRVFDCNKDYQFTYISHCAECNVLQNGAKHRFLFKE